MMKEKALLLVLLCYIKAEFEIVSPPSRFNNVLNDVPELIFCTYATSAFCFKIQSNS